MWFQFLLAGHDAQPPLPSRILPSDTPSSEEGSMMVSQDLVDGIIMGG
jgi:hypothetical protein